MIAVKSSDALAELSNSRESIVLEWKDVSYSRLEKDSEKSGMLSTQFKKKDILCGLNGCAKSGRLLAIMGPTGCGKTSLLNVLAARVSTSGMSEGQLQGQVLINGKARDDNTFRRVSAYVLQDDKLYPHLTMHETLLLAAHFFLPSGVSDEQKEDVISNVMMELGLGKTRDTIIGDEKVRGVSGGERKRANIAVQLISNPQVLFMDEPTSGLDSFQAQSVMEAIKNLARSGRLVISVIHQPRSSIYQMFDDLLLLSNGKTM